MEARCSIAKEIKTMTSILFAGFCMLTSLSLSAQEYLQIDTYNDPTTKKYHLGEQIVIRTTYNEDWIKITPRKFLYDLNTIVYDDGMLRLDEIAAIRETRPGILALSTAFTTFGGAWLIYGLISKGVDSGSEFDKNDIIIGAVAVITGIGLRKAFYKRDYVMGKRYKLRLLDLRMNPAAEPR
ncbi:MAG: hypothetical protein IPN29_21295 [Saprospiraceae bacterium]|nr:hypothetical protein [Saprospiraceae bacterium]